MNGQEKDVKFKEPIFTTMKTLVEESFYHDGH